MIHFLPEEVLEKIFLYLNKLKYLREISLTCRGFHVHVTPLIDLIFCPVLTNDPDRNVSVSKVPIVKCVYIAPGVPDHDTEPLRSFTNFFSDVKDSRLKELNLQITIKNSLCMGV